MASKKIVLVDGHALVYRAFHALPQTLSTAKGELTNAVYGFTQMLLDVIARERPDCIVMTFDIGKSFRHDEFDGYKAHRKPMPDELVGQLGRVRQVVETLNIPVYEVAGYEADDVIGSLAKNAEKLGLDVVVVTGDSDALQLVNDGVRVATPGARRFSEVAIYDRQAVEEKYGFPPEYVVDYKALVGDTSDNIPGVPGIGKKSATDLICRFGGVESIYEHLDEVTPKRTQEALRGRREDALRSKRLASIVVDLPLEIDVDKCRLGGFDRARVVELFRELEFRSLLVKIPSANQAGESPEQGEPPVVGGRPSQLSLFSDPGPVAAPVATVGPSETRPEQDDYCLVQREEDLERLASRLGSRESLTVDVETTGKNAMEAELVGVSIAMQPGEAFYLPLGHTCPGGSQEQVPIELLVRQLGPLMADRRIGKIAHNGKYDLMVLRRHGLDLAPLAFDTMIAAYLLGETSLSLRDLSFVKLGLEKTPITELLGKNGRNQITMAEVPIERVFSYACTDVDLTIRLAQQFRRELELAGLMDLFDKVEMPLVPILCQMEMDGVALDVPFLMEMSKVLYSRVVALEEEIYEVAGHRFNLNSPLQLSGVLFDQLGLPGSQRTQTGFSTNVKVLEKLRGRHPIVDLILDYRQLSKLKSTYVDALPLLVNPRTGRVHTSFNQTIASTGRLSSSDPNLQNIPIRSDIGREVRRAFVADNFSDKQLIPGPSVLMSADYSQIELRILAHVSGDVRLMRAFLSGEDIHSSTASEVFGVATGEVTSEMRRVAKTVNFGIMYGMSSFGLARDTGLTQSQASRFIHDYMEKYNGVRRYVEQTLEEVRDKGYATTLLGRRRYIPEIHSTNPTVRQAAERMAINMPIQGTAADIIKIAMINLDRELRREKLGGRILLQVHDELVLEVPEAEVERTAALLKSVMENAFEIRVPLSVDVKTGHNWGEMSS